MPGIIDNTERHRFELTENGHLAFADYQLRGNTLVIPYVEAAPELRGTGAAGRLLEGVMHAARERGLKVLPVCGYAAGWLKRHKEHGDLAV